jgi:hypothetical protein
MNIINAFLIALNSWLGEKGMYSYIEEAERK